MDGIFSAWGRILTGYTPALSIEITRECPLRCPGCYAYGDDHLGGDLTLRQVRDFKGQELVDGIMALVDKHRPLHVSLVGGEPLVRYKELNQILPMLAARGIHAQLVTSAVREIPKEWHGLPRLSIVVSIDGLQPEHDVRRTPATYDRILKHIKGQQVTVHCTVTRQQTRPGYLQAFTEFWAAQPDVKRIWFSLYTPQKGEDSPERLLPADRRSVVEELTALLAREPKLSDMRPVVLAGFLHPPQDPSVCIFAQTTACLSSDLERRITPCQYGGDPDCTQCGCLASVGLDAVGRRRLAGLVPVSAVFKGSLAVGAAVRGLRGDNRRRAPASAAATARAASERA
jgi:MoaA/NifB/PqqE/SkfB family radical SAM enzyme